MAPRVLTDEEFKAMESEQASKPRTMTDDEMQAASSGVQHEKSSYEGTNDDDLNFIQRAEKKAGDWGLVKPGHELFSPAASKNKKAVLKQAADELTAGYEPQIEAGLKTGSVSSPDYIEARDKARHELDTDDGANKLIGRTVGAAPWLAVPGLKATTALGRVGAAAATGAAFGAVSNPGDETGKLDPVQAEKRLTNAKRGAEFAGGVAAVPEVVGAAAKYGPGFIKKAAVKTSNFLTGMGGPKNEEAATRVIERPDQVMSAYTHSDEAQRGIEEAINNKMDVLRENVANGKSSVEQAQSELDSFKNRLESAAADSRATAKDTFREAQEGYKGAADEARLGAREAKQDFSQAAEGQKQRLKAIQPSPDVENEVTGSVNKLKQMVNDGSEESREILDKAGTSVDRSDLLDAVKAAKGGLKVQGVPIGEGAKSALAKLDGLEADISQLPERISGSDAKTIVQRLDPDINFIRQAGQYMDPASRSYLQVREGVDQLLKVSNNDYARKMQEVAYLRGLLGNASEEFGDRAQLPGRLMSLDKPQNHGKVDLLEAMHNTTDGDYLPEVQKYLEAKGLLKDPGLADSLPEAQRLGQAQAKLQGLKQGPEAVNLREASDLNRQLSDPRRREQFVSGAVDASGLPSRVSGAESDLAAAQAEHEPFKSLTPSTVQNKVVTAATGKNHANEELVGQFADKYAPDVKENLADLGAAKAFGHHIGPSGSNAGRRTLIGGGTALAAGFGATQEHDPVKKVGYGAIAAGALGAISPAANIRALSMLGKTLQSPTVQNAVNLGSNAVTRNPGVIKKITDYANSGGEEGPAKEVNSVQSVLPKTAGTRYEAPLRKAAERGTDSFSSTYFIMAQTDPEFRRLMEDGDDSR